MREVWRRGERRRARDGRRAGRIQNRGVCECRGGLADLVLQVDAQHQTAPAVGEGHRRRVPQKAVVVVRRTRDVDLLVWLPSNIHHLGSVRQAVHREHDGTVLEMTEF